MAAHRRAAAVPAARTKRVRLARYNEELEQKVAERTRSLQEMTEQLNSFVQSVAHDLRAPLRSQLSLLRALLEDQGHKLDDAGRDYVRRLAQTVERQGNILQDLLAHITVGRPDLPMESVSLGAAVEQAKADLAIELQEKKAVLDLTGLAECHVRANASSLHLIVLNLLSNACKFVRAGTQPRIRLRTEQQEGFVRLWVEDNGIGIEHRHLGKLFGPFQRLHPIEAYPGTGMGLAIIKRAAERMGGSVGVESEPGQGSRFWVQLRQAPGGPLTPTLSPSEGAREILRSPGSPRSGARW